MRKNTVECFFAKVLKRRRRKKEGGQKFLPPTPFLFARPLFLGVQGGFAPLRIVKFSFFVLPLADRFLICGLNSAG
jgi:hypothetical protein